MLNLTPRTWFFLGFLFCAGLLLAAAYFEYVEGLEPCPLCITQRLMVLAVGLVLLAAALHHPGKTGTRVYALLGSGLALLGAAVSARHVWLQHLPPEAVPACGPGLEYMLNNFPLVQTLGFLFSGTGECAEVSWSFLGLSMPAWTLLAFIVLGSISLPQFWNART